MRSAVLVFVVFVVTGCNAVYGLDRTVARDAAEVVTVEDRDHDGVLDEVDNCPDTVNPGQEDLDQDGTGDVCDPCSFLFDAAFDRDGDAMAPTGDNCPGIENAPQVDADLDGVGDACDPAPGVADTLRCFEDFSTGHVPVIWPLGGPWKTIGSLLFHTPPGDAPFSIAARASGLPPTRGVAQIELQNLTIAIGAETGVAVGAADLSAGVRCELIGTGASPRLRLSDARGMLTEEPAFTGQRLVLTLEYRIAATTELACTVSSPADGMRHTITATTDAAVSPVAVGLFATNAMGVFRSLAIYE